MKSEDFERLKDVCEKEGFEIFEPNNCDFHNVVYLVKKSKDIWEGVEFVDRNTTNFPICRFSRSYGNTVWYYNSEGQEVCWPKDQIKPSTESVYIEQLKAEAFKRFGDIESGDQFINPHGTKDVRCPMPSWSYNKEYDWLYYGTCMLYKQGKWANRVPERVKVDPDSAISITDAINQCFRKDSKDFSKFIASKLEEYLNK